LKQIKISIEKEWTFCVCLRKEINFFIDNYVDLQRIIDLIRFENPYEKEKEKFSDFIKELVEKTYNDQQNNHNLMYTILKEKILTHVRINYAFLEESLEKNRLPYAKNLGPKTIFSNSYFSNKNEKILKVNDLERAFLSFTRSDDKFLPMDDKKIKDIVKYFALQFTRREHYLLSIIKEHMDFFKKQNFNDLDLLDYLMIKYIYNITLESNFRNWLGYIEKDDSIIYQLQYTKDLEECSKKEADLLKNNENTIPRNLAISEAHTFIISEIVNGVGIENLKIFFEEKNIDFFTSDEIKKLDHIFVTIGSDNKLCYLLNDQISLDIFDKINTFIRKYWDDFIACRTITSLLLNKNSELNSVNYFKNVDSYIYENAKFMYEAFKFSDKYEEIIRG